MRFNNMDKDAPEYGDGFFFTEWETERPETELIQRLFHRAKELETFCKESVDVSVRVKMDWELNIERKKLFPYIEILWDGSDYNSLRLEMDYCYKFFYREDKAFVNLCIANAIRSLRLIRGT